MTFFLASTAGFRGGLVRASLTAVLVISLNAARLDHWLFYAPPQATIGNRWNVTYVHAVDKIARPDASVAVTWAGAFPYFSGRYCVDLLGKSDPYIARLPVLPNQRRPGHNKHHFWFSLTRYRPDVYLPGLAAFSADYRPVAVTVDGVDVAFSIRADSPKVRGGRLIDWETAAAIKRRMPNM